MQLTAEGWERSELIYRNLACEICSLSIYIRALTTMCTHLVFFLVFPHVLLHIILISCLSLEVQ